jgi:nucleoside-diphosphate-sugar epimerase
MHVLITGGAGFIGSNLVKAFLDRGDTVSAVDCFTDYYDNRIKKRNLQEVVSSENFNLVEADLATCEILPLLETVDVVFHQAGQPGVRLSWDNFHQYVERNVLVTQRLLEAARSHSSLKRLVYASSSSVYGDAPMYPVTETTPTKPVSPYGVTKLAGEHLCSLYGTNWGVPTISLRYFTVYGPGQRPDMAIHRLINSALTGVPFPLFGDGTQIRDFTYVGDVVAANIAASYSDLPPGEVYNVCGGNSVNVLELISYVEEFANALVPIDHKNQQAGDVQRTGGSSERTASAIGWTPKISIRDGIAEQVRWQKNLLGLNPTDAI